MQNGYRPYPRYSRYDNKLHLFSKFTLYMFLVFAALNISVSIIAFKATSLEISFLAFKLLNITFVFPVLLFGFPCVHSNVKEYLWERHGRVKKFFMRLIEVISIAVLVLLIGVCIRDFFFAVDDLNSKPEYITGAVEKIAGQYKGPNEISIKGYSKKYTLRIFNVNAVIGKTYEFRIMQKSHEAIPVKLLY